MTPQQANELLLIGSQMSNVLWNLGQHKRREITEREGELFYALAKKWDEARRAPAPTEPAVDRDAVLVSRAELQAINHAMDHMGDQLNEIDSVEESDLAIVGPGFDAIQRLLATPASPAVPDRDHLLKIIAFAYQIAGAHDAPEHILAVLAHPESATAAQVDAMLPYQVGAVPAVPMGAIGAQEFLNWNRSQGNPPAAIMKEMGVYRKAVEIYLATDAKRAVPEPAPLAPSQMLKADPTAMVALALSGALPDAQAGEILSAAYAPQVAQASQPTSAEGKDSERLDWQPITAPGQVKAGDKLRFNIGDEKFNERVKRVINEGYADEELIYNIRKNFYLITSMAIGKRGSAKNIEFQRASTGKDTDKEAK